MDVYIDFFLQYVPSSLGLVENLGVECDEDCDRRVVKILDGEISRASICLGD